MSRLYYASRYDEETNEWILPSLTIESIVLPLSINLDNRSVSSGQNHPGTRDFDADEEEEARLYAKLSSRSQNHTKYFKNNRLEKLLLGSGI